MTYISLYRKYRSQDFDDIIGQTHIVATLKNAISANRLAHAYLFCGQRGTGKTSLARIFAKGLNCLKNDNPTIVPCNTCQNCTKIRDGQSADVIEIDAASNRGIDEIRDLREKIRFQPMESRYKVYIIDEVHMLTAEAFNALLKTLEEPPQHACFILATTSPQKVPATIISRCQRLDFSRIPFEKISAHLQMICQKEGSTIDAEALNLVVRYGDGSMRDSISLLDQLISFCGEKITVEAVVNLLGVADDAWLFDLTQALLQNDLAAVFAKLDAAMQKGIGVAQLIAGLIQYFRNLLFLVMGAGVGMDLAEESINKMRPQAQGFSVDQLKAALRIITQAELDLRWQSLGRVVLEVALMDMAEVLHRDSVQKITVTATQPSAVSPKAVDTLASKPASSPNDIAKMYKKIKLPDDKISTIQNGLDKITSHQGAAATLPEAAPHSHVDKLHVSEKASVDSLALIQQHWSEILNLVRQRSLFSYVSLHEGEPIEIDPAGKVIIAFRKGFSFHKSRLDDPAQKRIVEEVISQVVGSPQLVGSVITERVEKVGTGIKSVSVDKITEMFGGRVVS